MKLITIAISDLYMFNIILFPFHSCTGVLKGRTPTGQNTDKETAVINPLFVLVAIVTEKENEVKSKIVELSPEQEVKRSYPIGTLVPVTIV